MVELSWQMGRRTIALSFEDAPEDPAEYALWMSAQQTRIKQMYAEPMCWYLDQLGDA